MLHIGLRNIKTAAAIAACLLVNLVLVLIDRDFAATWFSPFFAGIAAAYSVQSDHDASFRQARIRSVGSVIGGFYGLAIVLLYEGFFAASVTAAIGEGANLAVFYALVTLAVVPLIQLTVVTRQTLATFVVVLTYLSVTVSTRNMGLPPFEFAVNRIGSTIVGSMLAFLIDSISFSRRRVNHDLLFVCGLDGAILNRHGQLDSFSKYKLKHLLREGVDVTIATTRTPASLFTLFQGIDFRMPLILMNGTVVYDARTKTYSEVKALLPAARDGIEAYLDSIGRECFAYAIVDDLLAIYHGGFANPAEKRFYDDRKFDFFKNHVKGRPAADAKVVFFILIDKEETVRAIADHIRIQPFGGDVVMNVYPFDDVEGYWFLKINGISASKEQAVCHLVTSFGKQNVVAVGGKAFDVPMMQIADYAIALESADPEARAVADLVIPGNDPDQILRVIDRIRRMPSLDRLHRAAWRKHSHD